MDWHPLIVHYPIALLSLSPLCDLGSLWLRRRDGHHLAYGLMLLGTVGVCAAVLSGNIAAAAHGEGPAVVSVAAHEDLATWTLLLGIGIVLGRLPLHLKGNFQGRLFYVWIALGIVVGVLVLVTGYYGGELVYIHGVGVGEDG